MKKLSDLLAIEDSIVKQATLKKVFMPYSENVDIDGCEKEALTILVNLSSHHKGDKCADWLDEERAKRHLKNTENIEDSLAEIKWLHTHNLKFPDCRVKDQRVIAKPLPTSESFISSAVSEYSLGWAHNAADYRHTQWILNSFNWQSKPANVLFLAQQGNPVWLELLQDLGLNVKDLVLFQKTIQSQLPVSTLPEYVNSYSKQLRFPWGNDYLSVTPVVSHAIQRELECRRRDPNSSLNFVTMSLPNSASIGNLCGSVGGYMKVLNYPIGARLNSEKTLSVSRQKSGRYFDDYQVTNSKICKVLSHLIGAEPLKTHKQRTKARKDQAKILRRQIALWILPLIELRDLAESEPKKPLIEHSEQLVQNFLTLPESELQSLATLFNQRLHFAFQENEFARKFAYHPKLMQVAKAQVKWVLDKLSQPHNTTTPVHEEQYIYLSSLRIQDAVAMSSPYLCGAPSLTAIWGVMHHYQREFNQLIDGSANFEFSSFALYVRSEAIRNTAKLTEPNSLAKARTISNAMRPTIRREMLTDLEIDLVIKVKSNDRISDYATALKASLPFTFAGGTLFQPLISSNKKWLRTFNGCTDLFYSLKGLPAYGSWLYACDKQPKDLDELEASLERNHDVLPISLGFHFLEQPKTRKNALTGSHAYVENALGIAERVNPIEVRFAGRDHFFNHAFWSLECSGETILIKKDRN
ncbi:type I-F CRISPR-associated protein Csy2 [Vibrio tapetis]|uniref:CRISPR-associated protein, Csy2 family n=1 Tax=Vibrio tapetis subsp. tapetis TaxID=1671868 RepID=A0A2N8ZDF1_9VIBR|nr:type I-F CRISPR-associated protein Csy2 [Vibrio tapetis]SON49916.1 conserved protein of unknown function [Vibrio tapetis subsp. tapetis]